MRKLTTIKMAALQNSPSRQTGMSLIELMIASVIGLFILAGAVTVFSGNNKSSSMSTGMTRLQDSGRVAIDIITDSVRMAGYNGCQADAKDSPTILASNAPEIALPATAIWGGEYDGAWNPVRPEDLVSIQTGTTAGSIKKDTDIIYLQSASGRASVLLSDMTAATANLRLQTNPDSLAAGDLIIVSNCNNADIFRATAVSTTAARTVISHGDTLNEDKKLSEIYTGSGETEATALRVMKFNSAAYFVGYSGRSTPKGDPIFSLFSLDTSTNVIGNPTELIEGVEDIQILYGEMMDPANDIRYVSADNVTDMNNVKSVQIGLLIATADYASELTDTRSYNIAGTTVSPPGGIGGSTHAGDRRLRTAFNTTIQIRNR